MIGEWCLDASAFAEATTDKTADKRFLMLDTRKMVNSEWGDGRQMADDSIIYYTLQCEVWLDISAGGGRRHQ